MARYVLIVLVFTLYATPSFSQKLCFLSAYKNTYKQDFVCGEGIDSSVVISKEYINAFLSAKRLIEGVVESEPFEAAIYDHQSFNASMSSNGIRGRLMITTGAIEKIKSDVDLYAALIGHEAGHFIQGHGDSKYSTITAMTIISAIVLGQKGIYANQVAEGMGRFATIPYSRQTEYEADKKGLELLQKSGVRLDAVIDLMSLITSANEVNQSFLSAHPHTDDRVVRIKEEIKGMTQR